MPANPDGAALWASLSKRERSIAAKFAEGLDLPGDGAALFIAPTTVRTHLAAIYRKLYVHNKAALINLVLAQREGAETPERRDRAATAPNPAPPGVERRLAAILVADVAGYSRLVENDETGIAGAAHGRPHGADRAASLQSTVAGSSSGWGTTCCANSPASSTPSRCAIGIQQGMAEREQDQADGRRIRLRIGVTLGDVVVEDGDIYGDGVNIAARLERLAEPGGIILSGAAHDHLQGKLDCSFAFLGERRLRGIERPVPVYQSVADVGCAFQRHDRAWAAGSRAAPADLTVRRSLSHAISRLDPEDLQDVVAASRGAVTAAVERQGGHVVRYFGDWAVAYFGWPTAHEDDAERAVRAGLAVAEAVGGLAAGPLAPGALGPASVSPPVPWWWASSPARVRHVSRG